MILQILHRGRLTCRIGKAGLYELAKHSVVYPIESHVVKDMVKYQVCSIGRDIGYV